MSHLGPGKSTRSGIRVSKYHLGLIGRMSIHYIQRVGRGMGMGRWWRYTVVRCVMAVLGSPAFPYNITGFFHRPSLGTHTGIRTCQTKFVKQIRVQLPIKSDFSSGIFQTAKGMLICPSLYSSTLRASSGVWLLASLLASRLRCFSLST